MPATKQLSHTKKLQPVKKKPRLTERERGIIESFHQAGVSALDIARMATRSRDTVGRVILHASPGVKGKVFSILMYTSHSIHTRVRWMARTEMENFSSTLSYDAESSPLVAVCTRLLISQSVSAGQGLDPTTC
ncbi:putative retroelement [Phytophthora cinnamomi]|uniref:putative retroelement n=1 Tax=Phytophthora cinnamomi TaxID=4785 RepID=UPI00355A80F5|nr:putative retroelement [Phytophthora cinnamomi]